MSGPSLTAPSRQRPNAAPAPVSAGGGGSPAGTATPAIQLWSGGKDSAMALWTGRRDGTVDVQALASTIAQGPERTTWHGVRTELMRRQADAIGLPFHPIPVSMDDADETNASLMAAISAFLRTPAAAAFPVVVWGDLFWEEARRQHEQASADAGKRGAYPLWDVGHDTAALARAVVDAGFKAVVTSVDTNKLDASFCGRPYDAQFLADLPDEADQCGERGEFHTFVWDGPIFREPVRFRRTRIARFRTDVYCDLEPAD